MIDRGTIWIATLEDLGSRCSVDTTLDIAYVQRRIAEEGESFLTNSLPQFGKDFERSLEDLAISHTAFTGFGRRKRLVGTDPSRLLGGGIPKFLSGFFQAVFDDEYDVSTVELHQLQAVVNRHNLDVETRLSEPGSEETPENYIQLAAMLPPLARPTAALNKEGELKIADAIAAIRQLCLMFGKEKSLCAQPLIDEAVEEFIKTDEELMLPFSTEE